MAGILLSIDMVKHLFCKDIYCQIICLLARVTTADQSKYFLYCWAPDLSK
jgi:hypothetical protein